MPELVLWTAPRPIDGFTRMLEVLRASEAYRTSGAVVSPDSRPWVLVLTPDQMTFQVEQALFQSDQPGSLSLHVYSFKRFAWRVFQTLGGHEHPPLTTLGQTLLVARALHLHGDAFLTLQRALKTRGLLEKVNRMIKELRHYNIEPDMLLKVRQDLSQNTLNDMFQENFAHKLDDLYRVYQDVYTRIEETYLDQISTLRLLAEKIPDYVAHRPVDVFVLGFSSFSPEERSVLAALLKHARSVHVLLNGLRAETGYPDVLKTKEKLLDMAQKLAVPVSHQWVPYDQSIASPETIEWMHVSARDRSDQYERLALYIRREVRRGRKFRDFAIVTGRLETDREWIERIFRQLDIPVFIDQAEEMRHHPLLRLLSDWLEQIADEALDTALIIDMLKTGLLVALFGELQKSHALDLVEELENFCLAYGIRGRHWWMPYFGLQDERAQKKAATFEGLRQKLIDVFRPFMGAHQPAKADGHPTGYVWSRMVWDSLSVMHIHHVLARWMDEAATEGEEMLLERHEQAWNGLIEVLEALVEVLGDVPLERTTFAEIMLAALDGLTFKTVPQTVDAVIVADFKNSRMLPTPVIIFANAVFGELPPALHDEGFLLEAERQYLLKSGLELAPDMVEAVDTLEGRFYEWLGTARETVVFSTLMFDENGERLSPAPIMDEVQRFFPKHTVLEEPLYDAMPPKRAFRELIHLKRLTRDGAKNADRYAVEKGEDRSWMERALEAALLDIQETRPLVQRLREGQTPVDLKVEVSEHLARALFGQPLKLSATYLESFYSCPYLFWARHGLGLEERKVFKISAVDTGVLYHETLQQLGRSLVDASYQYQTLSFEDIEKRASELLQETGVRSLEGLFSYDARHQSMLVQLAEVMKRASRAYFAHLKKSDFVPKGFEVPIQSTFSFPQAKVSEIILEGKVDRYDVALIGGTEYIRLIDYKSSRYPWQWPYVASGLRLQLLLYLLTFLKEQPTMRPAAVLYLPVLDPIDRVDVPPAEDERDGEREEASEDALDRTFLDKYRAQGLLTADEHVLKAMDWTLKTKQRSPYLPVEFTAKGKDGKRSFHKSRSSVLDEHEWSTLLTFVEQKMIEAGENILRGQFTPQPYMERSGGKSNMPCRWCPYQGVCRFELDTGRHLVRPLAKTKDEARQLIQTTVEKRKMRAEGDVLSDF